MNAKNIFEFRWWSAPAIVFAATFLSRIFADMLFWARFGPYAVNYVEGWFYAGVAAGTHLPARGIYDLSVWVLRGLEYFLPAAHGIYAVEAASVIFSCAAALSVYVLVSELYGKKTGFAAGVIYGAMTNNSILALCGFTHDLAQAPIICATIFFAVKLAKTRKPLYGLGFIVSAVVGYFINDAVLIGVGVGLAYIGYEFLAIGYEKYAVILVCGAAVAYFTVLPWVMDELISELPQGVGGSDDLLPMTLSEIWLKYNILLFILPLGFLEARKRRDIVGSTLVLAGVIIGLEMSRGARFIDLGVPIISALALTGFSKKQLKKTMWWSAALYVIMILLTYVKTEYNLIFLLCGIALVHALGKKDILLPSLAIIVILGFSFTAAYVYSAGAGRVVTQTEYELYGWLSENNDGGLLLVSWTRGYMAEVVANIKSVSSPNFIRYGVHKTLWENTDTASNVLADAGVKYVMISSEDLELVDVNGKRGYALRPGLVFDSDKVKFSEIQNTAIYKLRYMEPSSGFRLLRNVDDPITLEKLMLYEVMS